MNRLVALLVPVAITVSEWYRRTSWTGWVVLVVLWSPVVMLILASVFARPISPRLTRLFLALLAGLSGALVLVTYLLSGALGLLLG